MKNIQTKFHENPSSGNRVVPCEQTDCLRVAFRNFVANAPEKIAAWFYVNICPGLSLNTSRYTTHITLHNTRHATQHTSRYTTHVTLHYIRHATQHTSRYTTLKTETKKKSFCKQPRTSWTLCLGLQPFVIAPFVNSSNQMEWDQVAVCPSVCLSARKNSAATKRTFIALYI